MQNNFKKDKNMDSLKNLLSTLKNIRHIKLILAFLAVGILLCIYSPVNTLHSERRDIEATISELLYEFCGADAYVCVESDSLNEPVGVVILLPGANDGTRLKINEMLVSLYNIPSNRIYIGEKFT